MWYTSVLVSRRLLREAAGRVGGIREDSARTTHGHFGRAALATIAVARRRIIVARARDGGCAVDANETFLAPGCTPAVANDKVR
eukprot:COSAG02_NODE_503_length_20999_cov_7.403110_4_plen_84_part_00